MPFVHMSPGRSKPPKKRMTGRVPLVANVSRRRIASNSASREFSSAQIPVNPPAFISASTARWPADWWEAMYGR